MINIGLVRLPLWKWISQIEGKKSTAQSKALESISKTSQFSILYKNGKIFDGGSLVILKLIQIKMQIFTLQKNF